jgi:hypothetical protein
MMAHPKQIPLTPQTDPASFPQWVYDAPTGQSGALYPKMLTRKFAREEREAWRKEHKKMDIATERPYYEERCPNVGAEIPVEATMALVDAGFALQLGEPVIAKDAGAERAIRLLLKGESEPLPEPKSAEISVAADSDIDKRIAALEAENAKLREAAPQPVKRRRRGRPAKAVQAVSAEDFTQV